MILIGVIFFWVNYIEVSSNEYVVFNEKDERLNAIVIAKGDLIVYSYQADPSNGGHGDPLNGGKLTP
jgi:hypothetical protein